MIYRWANATAGAEVPVEGSTPAAGNTNGTATVACVISSAANAVLSAVDGSGGTAGCTTTALTVGQAYTYKVFQKDVYGNYDTGVVTGPYTSLSPVSGFNAFETGTAANAVAGSIYTKLAGKVLPEEKRKVIGGTFIEIFDQEAHKLEGIEMLGQGTIYPDVIESVSVHGPSQTIKSHHNVGGLPDTMKLDLVEPLRYLFKDEVRKVGLELGIPHQQLFRHPFPGPGLAIRILGEITEEKVETPPVAEASNEPVDNGSTEEVDKW